MKTPAEDHADRDYLVTMAAFALAALAFVVANREPARDTKPLNAWLRELNSAEPYRRARAEAAVRQMGPRVVPALVVRLESSYTDDQARAILGFEALGDAGRPAIPSLTALLRAEATSLPAARALAAIGPATVPLLTNSLASSAGFIRSSAVRALGRMRTDGRLAVPALVSVLNDDDDDLRYFATRALGNLAADPEQAVPALVNRLEDRNVEVRKIAARSLGQFHGQARGAVPALRKALNRDEEAVKLTAAYALREINPGIATDRVR